MAGPPVSLTQRLIWRLEAIGFDLVGVLVRLVPVDLASRLGGAALRWLGPLTRAHKTADRNIRLAFPDMEAQARRALLAAQWDSLGRLTAEFTLMDRITPATGRVRIVGGERLRDLAASGQTAVLVSGHFSNWEVMATVIVHLGVKCQVTYRAANNPHIDARIIESRRRYGVTLFAPKGDSGSREILHAMGEGEAVALLNDQKFNQGIAAPFFGHLAHTAPGPTRLALRFGCQMIPMSAERTQGANFVVTIHEPLPLIRSADRAADIEAGVRLVNAFIEDRVRARPQEWFWTHKRWPAELYRETKVDA